MNYLILCFHKDACGNGVLFIFCFRKDACGNRVLDLNQNWREYLKQFDLGHNNGNNRAFCYLLEGGTTPIRTQTIKKKVWHFYLLTKFFERYPTLKAEHHRQNLMPILISSSQHINNQKITTFNIKRLNGRNYITTMFFTTKETLRTTFEHLKRTLLWFTHFVQSNVQ